MSDYSPMRMILRGAGLGTLNGGLLGTAIGTVIFPVLGTIAGAAVGAAIGLVFGLVNGVALAVLCQFTVDPWAFAALAGVLSGVGGFVLARAGFDVSGGPAFLAAAGICVLGAIMGTRLLVRDEFEGEANQRSQRVAWGAAVGGAIGVIAAVVTASGQATGGIGAVFFFAGLGGILGGLVGAVVGLCLPDGSADVPGTRRY